MADRRLTEDEAAAIFRRAAELDDSRAADGAGGGSAGGLERVAVERAAVEVGLSVASVRRALAELDAGQLRSAASASLSLRSRWRWADGVATIERRLPLSAVEAQAAMETYLRRQTLRVARRRGPVSVWEPASGLTASIVRTTDLSGRLRLKSVSQVTLCVVADDAASDDEDGQRRGGRGGRGRGCHVQVDVDFSKARRENRGGAIAGAVLGVAIATGGVVGAVVGGAEAALLAVPGGAAAVTGTWFGARSTYAKAVARAVSAVELALDELEEGVASPATSYATPFATIPTRRRGAGGSGRRR